MILIRKTEQQGTKSEMKQLYPTYHIIKTAILILILIGISLTGKAQLNAFQNMYFQNRYMYNPAMAGLNRGLNVNVNYRQQWSNFPGTPKTGAVTADYQVSEKVGLGINVTNDQSGLLRTTQAMGTYAYHLPLSANNQYLSFGASLGIHDSRVAYDKINGDPTDGEVSQFNMLKPYVDGDFGVAYTSNKLTLDGALPNLKATLFNRSDSRFDADRLVFIGVASYKFLLNGAGQGFTLEPLGGYRIVKGYKDIVDLGANLTVNNYGVYLQGIYHTSGSVGIGCGLQQNSYGLNFNYTMETGQLSTYTNGGFEVGLKLMLFNK